MRCLSTTKCIQEKAQSAPCTYSGRPAVVDVVPQLAERETKWNELVSIFGG